MSKMSKVSRVSKVIQGELVSFDQCEDDNLCFFVIIFFVLCYVLIHISTNASTLSTVSGTIKPHFATGTVQSVTYHLTVTPHYFQQRFWSNIHVILHGQQFTLYCFPANILWMQTLTKP